MELDTLDHQILTMLVQSGRISNSQIGAVLRVSQSTVRKRVDRLIEGGACRVLAVVDPSSVGYRTSVIVLVKARPGRAAEVTGTMGSFLEVQWVAQTMGSYDVFVEAVLPGPEGIFDLVSRQVGQVPGVNEVETLVAMRQTRWRPVERRVSTASRASGRADRRQGTVWRDDALGYPKTLGGRQEAPVFERLDDVDMRIIELLQEDGRRPAAEIARMVRFSQPAIKSRIDRLVDRGVCSIVGVIAPEALGLSTGALVYVRTEPDRVGAVGDQLAALPEISWACHTTGKFDIVLEVHLAGSVALLEYVGRDIAAIPGIRSTEVALVAAHTGWRPAAWRPPGD